QLRQGDAPEDAQPRHAQCQTGLTLARMQGQQGTAEDFGGVGTETQPQGDGAGRKGAEGQIGVAEAAAEPVHQRGGAVVGHQYPERLRLTASHRGIEAADTAQGAVAGTLGAGTEQAKQPPQSKRGQRQAYGHPGPFQEGWTESV